MQRDQYLPLKVIRAHLEAIDAGETPALPGAASAVVVPRAARVATAATSYRGRRRHPRRCSTTRSPRRCCRAAELYGDDALGVLAALVALRGVGIEARHLRGLRAAAEREAALVERAIAPSRRSDAADKARAAERALELAEQLETVRSAVVARRALARLAR